MKDKVIRNKIHKLLDRALDAKENVFFDYSGHVKSLTVYSHPAGTEYLQGVKRERTTYINAYVDLERSPDLNAKLDEALRKLIGSDNGN